MHSPFHLQVNSQTKVAKIFHTSNNLAKVDLMTIGTTIAAVSRHSSWHWLSYFCISLLKGLHSLMMVSWWWFLTKIPPNHMCWNSLRVDLFLIVLIMMMIPSRARTPHRSAAYFGTPSIIRKCSIDEAKGKVCTSLREILRNAYEYHMQGCNESKNIQRYHYNTLEFACNSDMCIYVDSTSEKFKIGCLVCNKSALSPDVEGYGSIKEALTNTLRKVGVVH